MTHMLVAASRELLAVYEDHLLVVDVQGARHRVHVTEPLELLSASGRTVLGARDDVLVEYVVSPRGVLERARLDWEIAEAVGRCSRAPAGGAR